MRKASYPMLHGKTKGFIHILKQLGGLLPAHLGPQALSLNTATVWGDISTTILKNKEMSKNLRRMTDLLLSLSNILNAMYLGFCWVENCYRYNWSKHMCSIFQISKTWMKEEPPRHWDIWREELCVPQSRWANSSASKKGRDSCRTFESIQRTCQVSWCIILLSPMDLPKISLTWVQNQEDSPACVGDKHFVCDGSCREFSHGPWLGLASSSPWIIF